MAVSPIPRFDALLEGDDDDEPTCVGQFTPEEVSALMREADQNEANESTPPRSFDSGIRLTDDSNALVIETPLVVIPRAPLLPAIEDEADPDETVVASVLPPALAIETAADELARVLDFDWEAASVPPPQSDERSGSVPPLMLVRQRVSSIPREPIPWPATPALDAPRGYGRTAIAIAVAASIAIAALFIILASLFA
ncbi:MAG TPA: hypothetical protein VIF62_21005 [Labilithrix sp.]|jgi:hypothetical protein